MTWRPLILLAAFGIAAYVIGGLAWSAIQHHRKI